MQACTLDTGPSWQLDDRPCMIRDTGTAGGMGGGPALNGVHSTEGGGEAQAHAPLGVRLGAGHLVLNVQVSKHLLLLLKCL